MADQTTVLPTFVDWLTDHVSESSDGMYRHRLLKEDLSLRCVILPQLQQYLSQAHEDARCNLRRLAGDCLDPLLSKPIIDPADGYPELLDIDTLKGYFGEVFAGLVAEHFAPFGESTWVVPAFLFRFHDVAFDQLEMWRQSGERPRNPAEKPCLST